MINITGEKPEDKKMNNLDNMNYKEQAERLNKRADLCEQIAGVLAWLTCGIALGLIGVIVLADGATFCGGVLALAVGVVARFACEEMATRSRRSAELYRRLYHATPWRHVARRAPIVKK